MNAKKCDRCGEFYDIYKGIKFEEKTSQDTFNRLVICEDKLIAGCASKGFDLCPACMKSLILWIKRDYRREVNNKEKEK